MKDFLTKINSYNIFNFLFSGVVFSAFVSKETSLNLIQEDVLLGIFVYYFFGAVISRIGSLIVEPVLKSIEFVTFTPYKDFIVASKNDPKIEVLSEASNMYRTICALLLCIGLAYILDVAKNYYPVITKILPFISFLIILIVFIWSYKKQIEYINKRVAANLEEVKK